MKVYLVEQGKYDGRGVVGVYASPEAAMAANPPPENAYVDRPGGWLEEPGWPGNWWNGLGDDSTASIKEYELEELPP